MLRPIIAALTIAVAAPAYAQTPATFMADWSAAFQTAEVMPVTRFYAPDARLWSEASASELIGPADLSWYFTTLNLGPSPVRVRMDAQHMREVDNTALVTGRYTLIRERWDGSTVEEPCRFSLTLLRFAGGGWRIAEQHVSRIP